MKLRDVSQRIRPQDQLDFMHTLKGEQVLSELRDEQLADFQSTNCISNSQGLVFAKVEKETLL